MAITRTFSIIKPDATRRNITGKVNAMIEAAGLRIVAQKRLHLTKGQAEGFYAVHRERGFFGELVAFMISGPVVVQVLEGEDAVPAYRAIMGATNPANADAGEITDKGYINQGAVLRRRAAEVEALYAASPDPRVIRA